MARFAFIVIALPDDAPEDEHAIAGRLSVDFGEYDDGDDSFMGEECHFTVYNNLSDVVADQVEGCARNDYWLTGKAGDVAPLLPPMLAA